MDYEQDYNRAMELLNEFNNRFPEKQELEELKQLIDQLYQSNVNLDKMLGDVIISQQEDEEF